MNLDFDSNMNAIKINSKFDDKRSNNSAAVGLNFQAVFYVPRCKHRIILCHWFVAKTSKYRERLLVGLNFQAVGLNFQAVCYTRSDCTQSDTDLFVPTCR